MVGAAMAGAVAVGNYRDLNEAAQTFISIKETIEPRQKNNAVYHAAYQNYRDTFRLLSNSGIFNQVKNQVSQ
jgi:ribulose kinase